MQRIQSRKLSDVITEQLESMIIDGRLLAGQKLPSERELAENFAVSRPSLREAIQNLEARGLLLRKQGGGTFVKRNLTASVTDPLLDLIAKRPETQFDLLEFRHALEGMAAYYAALRGQPEDYVKLEEALASISELSKKSDKTDLSKALVDFYLAMAKASHNLVLVHVMRSLKSMLQENIKANFEMLAIRDDVTDIIHKQREKILAGIVSRDPETARQASNEHLAFIEDILLEINRQDTRIQRALRRIEIQK
ncbi:MULTISPECIES: pyruvate dehydrogenase complex transcriptional repressor PdhR [Alteromonadaceae]|uniref:pyruvate dehydrogenase complex transcriptional repressor PdhR n=1 Tax=Alteromonadaceae TaxID=72275 RepID=UPI001C0999E8|nr:MULTISPECIES: pyruvate dehydrogenase complex transcriptional repressor PdhR [Aliiglaciecola]MBU2876919.1 pyruvate dehydrogenase complex transcriptional repressor PdhR [Aliiglaciecola lipolytica]MDO6712609.1 pyruvate dehydrogenase complex transcriptional repressor PdhR [Aliiglaciecola sp. 2_MG-2023]MDO6753783.1 pyruvate dehydrogenase complex transcriptional repressor PdhR [Aliiglaciecola sp. 1_MG-2023]